MSKFIDRLNKLSRGETQTMGFTSRQTASPKPKIQLVARLAAESAESLSGHLAGADAGLLGISKSASCSETLQTLSKSLPDVIWGGWLQGGSGAEIKNLTEAGFDFIAFSANSTLTVKKDADKTGRMLELDASLSDGLLRTVNGLLVDAVLITGEGKENQALTWQRMMIIRRLADSLTKPLLVPVSSQVTSVELEALWEAGIDAVVIEIDAKQPEDRLMKLRQEVNKTEFSSRRSRRADTLVPRTGQPSGKKADEEDE